MCFLIGGGRKLDIYIYINLYIVETFVLFLPYSNQSSLYMLESCPTDFYIV